MPGIRLFLFIALAALVAPLSASAENVHSLAAEVSTSEWKAPKREVRVIDISSANAVGSDHTHWYARSRMPVQRNAARPFEARSVEKKKKKTVRRRAPRDRDAYSAYASEPRQQRGGFGIFD
jgi:hypothetical protein